MNRIDFHTVDFSKVEILDNYNYHNENYHSYNLEFRLQEYPKERFLVCIDIWDEEWRIGRIAQMHHIKYYIFDDVLKEKFKIGLKKVLSLN
ncbi:hypothetical protein BWGOE4_55970 [Bacillus mycoides]|uniref:hypothetical protein n=1 Tax=Bacillus mycoides TaxID=1405 RepID=UPI000871C17D|nr:hypothetical protein [Bacillus mycoides]OFD52873.1 hypothetical protein BWGOE4_55970 [Bacillus mycoides]OFD56106.1 hypothetical protein BWGOE7_56110 [Bacillus mycoides]OFD87194.1 hypothetical protein BWGOE12_57700 [Bacillus mycoides]